eukprot:scaffold264_cov317-Pinguiococcus_pyrenoidosus.AAC.23
MSRNALRGVRRQETARMTGLIGSTEEPAFKELSLGASSSWRDSRSASGAARALSASPGR